MSKPDWEMIRREYETGKRSFRELAEQYGVAQTTLYRRSKKWNGTERNDQSGTEWNDQEQSEAIPLRLLRPHPSPANAVEGANYGLEALVAYLKDHKKELDLADHVKAANALSLYNKIIINAPADEAEEEQEDLSGFTEEELRQYAEFQERAKKRV